jgi:hypothetical protein
MVGRSYDGGLMVVGRAVNGWIKGILPDDLSRASEVTRYAQLVQDSVNGDGRCPMLWVTDGWGATEGYSTKRSAFWRAIRRVVKGLGLEDVQQASWPSHLVWSNLYKVSPADGGNPSKLLREVQFPGCAKLLNLELRTYQPDRVLFLTGVDWADPFLEEAKLQKGEGYQYVERVGDVHGARFVIAVHPQGKFEAVWAHEVVTAFDRQQQHAAVGAVRRR